MFHLKAPEFKSALNAMTSNILNYFRNYKKYEKMVENLMQGLRANQIKRLNVNF